jgi:hypothetical protein
MGSFIVLLVVFAPRGILGLVERFSAKRTGQTEGGGHG